MAPGNKREGQLAGDRWRIGKPLARGGMSTVYRGIDEQEGGEVAIKILRTGLKPELRSFERFQREARVASRLDHPNIVALRGHGEMEPGQCFLVMEYIDGISLHQAIYEEAPFGIRRALRIAAQIADALEHAHVQNVFHRDLKPGNVLLVHQRKSADQVKVLDFGLAKIQTPDETDTLTRAGLIFGTPEYMSPEQACGQAVDGRCDVYASGAILFEMIVGEPPFVGKGVFDTLRQQVIQPAPAPGDVRNDIMVPGIVERIILRCLEKRPENRFGSAAQLARALRAVSRQLAGRRSRKHSSDVADSDMPTMGQDRTALLDADEAARSEYNQLRRHRQETLRRATVYFAKHEIAPKIQQVLDHIASLERLHMDQGAELAVASSGMDEARNSALEKISSLRLANIDRQMEATGLRDELEIGSAGKDTLQRLAAVGEELVALEQRLHEAERELATQSKQQAGELDVHHQRMARSQQRLDEAFDELAGLVRETAGAHPGGELQQLLDDLDSFDRWIAAHEAIAGKRP